MILVLNPFSGISGDMFLGALFGLGARPDEVRSAVAGTGITGWDLDVSDVTVGGLVATRATVTVEAQPPARAASEILDLVRRARPAAVAAIAERAVTAIAEVEAVLHGTDPASVHLHEIGGVDTVVDTVGVAAALHGLGITEVYSAPVAVGQGTVRSAHGRLPAPAPATIALLRDATIVGTPAAGETVTPTGAALLGAIGTRYAPVPRMSVRGTGYGAGTHDFGTGPNVLQATLGTAEAASVRRPMALLETNVDDVTGEMLGYVLRRCLTEGAADAWLTPVLGKKGRPAYVVSVLCGPSDADRLESVVLRETGSLGLRRTLVDRLELPRETRTVNVEGHPIRLKSGPWRTKPEYDDVAAAAEQLDRPFRDITPS